MPTKNGLDRYSSRPLHSFGAGGWTRTGFSLRTEDFEPVSYLVKKCRPFTNFEHSLKESKKGILTHQEISKGLAKTAPLSAEVTSAA
jgi:hypothetical protein